MATPDAEKGGLHVPNSPAPAPVDIGRATGAARKETSDFDSDTQSITPESTGLPPAMDEKDQRGPAHSHYPAADQDEAIIVQRSKRRGLFGQLTLLAEVENPKTYARNKKWFITFIVAVAGATAPMGSSIFFRKSSRLVPAAHHDVSGLTCLRNSCPITGLQGPKYHCHRHEFIHCPVHA
jgi:hypothetical protein